MDTSIEFNIYGDASLLKEAQNVLTDLESEVSVTDPDSEIYKINQDGTGITDRECWQSDAGSF